MQNNNPIPGNQSQPPYQSTIPEPTLKQRGYLLPLIGIFILLVLVAEAAYLLGKNQSTYKETASQTAQVSQAPTSTIDPTTNWKTYMINSLGLTYKLPPSITTLGELQEFTILGQKGTQLFISTENSKVVSDKQFLAGTTSIDYMAGRGGMFIDLQGYTKQNGKYYAKFVSGQTFEIPANLITEIKNPNDLEIIKIKGENFSDQGEEVGRPKGGTPGQGKVGALINVNKPPYQGLAVQMDLTPTLTDQLFDQILSTFKFTDKTSSTGTTGWKTYAKSEYGFSVQYPPSWTSVDTSKEVGTDSMKFEGLEGEISIAFGKGFGGGCDVSDHIQIQTFGTTQDICHHLNADGTENFRGIGKDISAATGFAAGGLAKFPYQTNRQTILQIFSTFKLTQ